MPTERDAVTELEHLLDWLGSTPEQSGIRYELLRKKLITFFRYERCRFPEELTDRTLDTVSRQLADGLVIRAADPHVYCFGVARKLASTARRSAESQRTVSLADLPPAAKQAHETLAAQADRATEQAELEVQLNCLRRCLPRLPLAEREFLQAYYHDDEKQQSENRQRLAQRLGLTPVALRSRAHRLRAELRPCVKGCLERG